MNNLIRRISAVVALCALVAGACAGVALAAKAKPVSMTSKPCKPAPASGLCATYTGKPFGTCKMTGKLKIPQTIQQWSCSGGRFTVTTTSTGGKLPQTKGTWKATAGSGHYKKIRGGGTFTGNVASGVFKLAGTLAY